MTLRLVSYLPLYIFLLFKGNTAQRDQNLLLSFWTIFTTFSLLQKNTAL